jgi:hypothetical protein
VLWEGTNDIYANSLTGAQAWAKVVTYISAVVATGAQLVICTIIARDYSGEPAGVMDTEIPAYNTLVRANTALGYTVCDLAADSHFDARADASNTTYYNADKLHLALTGQNLVATLLTAHITPLL